MTPETRSTILQVARRLFVQQGYTATAMRQVAEVAGIGKATIYHHFADKQTILLALLEENMAQMQETLAVTRAETEPRRRFAVAAESSLRFLQESADIMLIVRRELPGGRDKFQAGFAAFLRDYQALLVEAVKQGMAQGLFRPVDPRQAVRIFMMTLQGHFTMVYIAGERPTSPKQAAVALLDMFFLGLEARP